MVLTKRNTEITKEELLCRIDQLGAYQWYCPGIKLGKSVVKNPYRTDKHVGNFGIYQKDGQVLWKDFADDNGGDIIKLVGLMHGITYKQAIQKIAVDMGIIQTDNTLVPRIAIPANPNALPATQSTKTLIQVTTRRWRQIDDKYWQKYGITREQLISEAVYPVAELYINRHRETLKPDERVYAYTYEQGMKIYLPDRVKESKWKSSISTKLVEGLDKLNGHEKVVICKSKKDRLSLAAILPPEIGLISVQNESISAWTDKLIEQLQGRQCWISYDSDNPGKQASRRVNEKFPWMKHVNSPDRYWVEEGIKDWADMIAAGYREQVIEHFRTKKIIE